MSPTASFWAILKRHIEAGHLRKAGTEMLAGALVMLIAGMILMGANLSELHKIGLSSQRTNDALTQAAVVETEILGIELAMRSYTLKPRQVYLDSFWARAARLRRALDKLRVILADQPAQSRRLANLHAYVERRMGIFANLLTLSPDRWNVLADTVTDLGLRAERQSALAELDAIRVDEIARVSSRQAAAERNVEQTFMLASGIVAFAFLLAAIGLVLVRGGGGAGAGGKDG